MNHQSQEERIYILRIQNVAGSSQKLLTRPSSVKKQFDHQGLAHVLDRLLL